MVNDTKREGGHLQEFRSLHRIDWEGLVQPTTDPNLIHDHNDYLMALEDASNNRYEMLIGMLKSGVMIPDRNLVRILGLIVERLKGKQRSTGKSQPHMAPARAYGRAGRAKKLAAEERLAVLEALRTGQKAGDVA